VNDKIKSILEKSPEAKRITKLERDVEKYKNTIKELEEEKKHLESCIESERRWRMDFQRLMKAAVQEDNLTEYERRYW
jgi:predicted  nucleic acid-binding Zn-ribbon protein